MIKMIVALNNNSVIGRNGKLLYRLKEDMKNFKKMTEGHTVVMGRKTFESLNNRALPNRLNVVVTSNPNPTQVTPTNDVVTFITPENFIEYFLPHHSKTEEPVWIIGGGQVYETATPFASEIICTFIDDEEEGDVALPDGLFGGFVQGAVLQSVDVDEDNDKSYDIVQLVRQEIFSMPYGKASEVDSTTFEQHVHEPFELDEEFEGFSPSINTSLETGGLKRGEVFVVGACTSPNKTQMISRLESQSHSSSVDDSNSSSVSSDSSSPTD